MSKAGFLLFYLLFMHVLSHCTVQIADPHNIQYIHVEFLSHAARVLCPCVQVGKDRIIMYHSHIELYTPTEKARLETYTNKKSVHSFLQNTIRSQPCQQKIEAESKMHGLPNFIFIFFLPTHNYVFRVKSRKIFFW